MADFNLASITTDTDGPSVDTEVLFGSPAAGTPKPYSFAGIKTWIKAWIAKADVGLGSVDNTADASKPVSTAQQTALDAKANLAGPTFTGTVAGITKTMVGLGSVDNTSDVGKPVSTAQQTALNLKANIASPTFTGTVGGISKAMVGLTSVDDTSDATKLASVSNLTNKTLDNTNTVELKDTLFTLQDNTTATKKAKFELSGITAANTRVVTLPDRDITLEGVLSGSWTPTVISGSGTFTGHTVTVNSATWQSLGPEWVMAQFDITLTALGSGTPAGTLSVSIPFTPTIRGLFIGFEQALTNAAVSAKMSNGAAVLDCAYLSSGATVIATGARVIVGPFLFKR